MFSRIETKIGRVAYFGFTSRDGMLSPGFALCHPRSAGRVLGQFADPKSDEVHAHHPATSSFEASSHRLPCLDTLAGE